MTRLDDLLDRGPIDDRMRIVRVKFVDKDGYHLRYEDHIVNGEGHIVIVENKHEHVQL